MAKSFSFSEPGESPGLLLWQTTITWQRKIKNILDPDSISHAQFVILALLLWLEETDQRIIQVEIVDKTCLDKMTVSKVLKKLAERKLIKRVEHPTDTRAKSTELTSKGRVLIQKLVPKVEAFDREFFGAIPKNEHGQFIDFLKKLVQQPS